MHSFAAFEPGERVVVAAAIDEEDRRYAWRRGTFVRYSNPQRFAVVTMDTHNGQPTVYLRPESLARELHTKDEHCAGQIADDGCCAVCGVSHTALCACGGRGFHRPGCPEIEET